MCRGRQVIPWKVLKRLGVYLFFLGLGIWLLSELLVTDRDLAGILFFDRWQPTICS